MKQEEPSGLYQKFGIQYDDSRSKSHNMILPPKQHQILLKNIREKKDFEPSEKSFEENVPNSGRIGINGISNIEIQKNQGNATTNTGKNVHLKKNKENINNLNGSVTEMGATGVAKALKIGDMDMNLNQSHSQGEDEDATQINIQNQVIMSDIKLNIMQIPDNRKSGVSIQELAQMQQFTTFDPTNSQNI